MLNWSRTCVLLASVCLPGFLPGPAAADETEIPASEKLRNDQEAISGRYARFERLLTQMADMLGHEDPQRAELLRRAISKGREQAIASELDVIAETLGNADFGSARERQTGVTRSLQALLKLLQSEDRRSSVEKERERLNAILKNVRNTIAEERAARGSAQNSTAPSNAAPAQKKALDKTDEILKGIDDHDDAQAADAASNPESENAGGKDSKDPADSADGTKPPSGDETKGDAKQNGESGDKDSGDKKSTDPPDETDNGKSPKDGENSEDKPGKKGSDSTGKPSENSKSGKPSEQGSDSQGQPSESQESQQGSPSPNQSGSPSQQSDDAQKTPGREQIEAARNLMQEALEQLRKQEREEAVGKQDDAIGQLQKAAKELEEMLKQLREEEKEMVLAALEARFQRLLALQTQIYETTVDLDATPRKDWLDNAISQCRELSQQQADLTRECSQTTGLLREDGTSVSILVAVEDIEADMGSVASRLQQTKTGVLTQSIETDIIEALNELIKATQREMEEMKSEERQQQQQQSDSRKKPPLVELMAEIRVLRSLQLRVNRRTKQVHELLLEGDPADATDLTDQLGELAERQNRLRESAVELAEQMEQK